MTRSLAIVAMAALGLAVAGCTDDGTPGANPSASTSVDPSGSATATPTGTPSPGSTVTGGPVATCAAGEWRATGASGHAATGGADATITGGEGIRLTMRPDGAATVDFTGMSPATFTATVAGTQAGGNFVYAGTMAGTIRTGGGTTATSGTWEPVGVVDWEQVRVTVDLTKPIKARPLDNVRIGDYAGTGADQTGNVVDVDPLLGAGRFECRGDTLVLTPGTHGITWTLRRA